MSLTRGLVRPLLRGLNPSSDRSVGGGGGGGDPVAFVQAGVGLAIGALAQYATTEVPAMAATPTAGNLLVLIVSMNNYPDGISIDSGWQTTSGWSEYTDWNTHWNSNHNPQQKMFYKIADGDETDALLIEHNNLSNSRLCATIQEFTNVDQDNPFDVIPANAHSTEHFASDGSVPSAAMTSVTADGMALIAMTISDEVDGSITQPAGYTMAATSVNTSATSQATAYKALGAIGTETPGNWAADDTVAQEVIASTLLLRAA